MAINIGIVGLRMLESPHFSMLYHALAQNQPTSRFVRLSPMSALYRFPMSALMPLKDL